MILDPSANQIAEIDEAEFIRASVLVDGEHIPTREILREALADFLAGKVQELVVGRIGISLEMICIGQEVTIFCWGYRPVKGVTNRQTAYAVFVDFIEGHNSWRGLLAWKDVPKPPDPYLDQEESVIIPIFRARPKIATPLIRKKRLRGVLLFELPIAAFFVLAFCNFVHTVAELLSDRYFLGSRPGNPTLLILAPVGLLIAYGFHRLNWRCPFCGKHLGTEFGRHCPCSAWPKKKSNS